MSIYDFSSPTQFLKYESDGKYKVVNKNNIISIKEIDYHNGKSGDFVEVLVDTKYGNIPLRLVFEGKIDDLDKYFEPYYL